MAQILVEWNYGLADHTGFLLQRSIDFGVTWPVNLSFSSTSLQYSDTNITFSGNTYSYKIAAANTYGTGTFSNTGSVTLLGLLVSQPQDVLADISSSVSFSVSASGYGPISYQWQSGSTSLSDGSRITGSISSSLTINNLQFADTGSYRVFLSNLVASATSSYAQLRINLYPPAIVTPPQNTSADVGNTFAFNVTASGGTPLYYQWQSGSTNLIDDSRITGSSTVGSTTASLTINNIQLSDSGSYRVLVSNAYGGVTSSYADGHVNEYAPLIVTHPVDQTTYLTGTASFNVTASGTAPLSYQWISGSTNLVDGARITGSNSASLRINNIQLTDSGSYKVFVSNTIGSVYSNTASLNISLGVLLTTDGTPFILGPYDTFEEYSVGATSSLSGGYGWSGGWVLDQPGTYPFVLVVAQDNSDGNDTGWIGSWGS